MSIRSLHHIGSEVEANNSSNTRGTRSDPTAKVSIFDGATQPDVRHSTFTTVGGDNITYVNYASEVNASEVKETLSALKPIDRSGYYVQPCMIGTREKIFGEIGKWLDDIDAPNVLWIVGSPGSGKSTVASSLVSQLMKRGRMGSNFAFKRGNITLSDPAAVWRTIAHDLARYDDPFASILVAVLKSGTVDPGRPDIASHFESLIMEPCTKRHNPSLPHDIPVIVLDGLDECGSDPSQAGQRKALLDTFVHWSHLPRKFKLIITGRDERVNLSFRSCCKQIELPTGADVNMDTTQDIRNFFERRFAEIGGGLSLDGWPGDKVLDTLTARAAGLFIWAETVIRFVEQGLPDEQLEHVLVGNLGEGDNVTNLYRQILELLFGDANDRMLNVLHQVATVIVLAKITLHVDDLPSFILQPKASVTVILNKLSSVISVGSDSGIRIRHLSFAEFMCDPHRCPQRFYIDRFKGSHDISRACFRLMKKCLKFNICDLETSYLPNKDVKDLSRRIMRNIGHPLIYSCRFWAAHIRDTPTDLAENVDLITDVRDFFQSCFLYWLEVMSLTEEVVAANIALLGVAGWIQVFDAKLSDMIRDGSRFIVNFFTPISESTPHIYISALPFAPRDSIIATRYRLQFLNTLSIHSGQDHTWSAGINVLRGHKDAIASVAFSPHGKQIVSGSLDKSIRVWDAETGEMVSGPFEGHTDAVLSVAFSPDGKQIVSGSSDKSIRVWDAETSEMVSGPFEGHTDGVLSITFSPDGKQIVSGSWDDSICVWDAETSEMVSGPCKGHTDGVLSVAFSLDGKQIVSGSRDKSIRVWDVETSEMVSGPFKGHTDGVLSVAFSPDGKQIVSGSEDDSICVWDAETGEMISGPFEGHTDGVLSVAFSPDGKQIVSGSLDNSIRVWDAETGEMVSGPFEGHTDGVLSVTFSPDGKWIVSGSKDDSICVWDAETSEMVSGSFEGHTGAVESVAFSPDGKQIVSGSHDRSIHVWDAETGKMVSGPFEGHTDGVLCVAFSPDGKQIVSGSWDKSICVWDAKTGEMVSGPFEGHTDEVLSIAFSPDGKQIVSGSWDKSIRVWDAETGEMISGPFKGHTDGVLSVTFSPDGKWIVSGFSDKSIHVWDAETGEMVPGPFEGHTDRVWSVAFSPDGKQIVSGSEDDSICVWDAETGEMVSGPFKGHKDGVLSVAFSPDGKQIVSGSSDNSICVWDADTGKMVSGPLEGHTGAVRSIAFSPNGKQIVSGSDDKSIRVWDAGTGQRMVLDTGSCSMEVINSTRSIHCISSGWVCCPHSISVPPVPPTFLFWVPYSNRTGLCGIDTLLVLSTYPTRVDLSQFVHGTSWTLCCSSYSSPQKFTMKKRPKTLYDLEQWSERPKKKMQLDLTDSE